MSCWTFPWLIDVCQPVQGAGLQGHRPYSCCMAVAETRWAVPEGAEASPVAAWLGARFGYCVIQRRQRSAAIAGKGFHSPAIVRSPRGLGTACLYSSNCFPTQVWIVVCRCRSWLPPGLAGGSPPFSHETINPSASGQPRLSSSPVVQAQPLHLPSACQPGCLGQESFPSDQRAELACCRSSRPCV